MRVVLVVGPSGAGKDSLLRHAKSALAGDEGFHFIRRHITRPPDQNEDNYYIDSHTFDFLENHRFFISSWQAHGNRYGIAHHTVEHTGSAMCICSISRGAVADFEAILQDVVTIEIHADPAVLQRRLAGRGREDTAAIAGRLRRAGRRVEAKRLIRFDNSTPFARSAPAFVGLLRSVAAKEAHLTAAANPETRP